MRSRTPPKTVQVIINASWGDPAASESLGDAIEAIPDVLVVAAAGNGGTDGVGDDNDEYPPSIRPPTTCRTSSPWRRSTTRAACSTFTNFGATSVHLSAPGEDVLSAPCPAHRSLMGSGTSMAAANTSGVAALAASAWPSLLGDAPGASRALDCNGEGPPEHARLGCLSAPWSTRGPPSLTGRIFAGSPVRIGSRPLQLSARRRSCHSCPTCSSRRGWASRMPGRRRGSGPDRNSAAPGAAERHPGADLGRDPATATLGDLRPRRYRRGVERGPRPARRAQLRWCVPASPERTATRRPPPFRRALCRACRMSSSPPASASPTRWPAFRPAVCLAGRCC